MNALKTLLINIFIQCLGIVHSNAQCSFTLTQGNLCSGGTSVVLTASVGGTNYQWFANGQPLSGSDYVMQGNQLTIYNPSGKFGLDFYSLVTSANCIPGVSSYQAATNYVRLSYNGTAPGATGTISGNTTPCIGQTFSYSVPTIANATDYIWSAPPGASISWISSDKKTISIYYATGSSNGNATVIGTNACGSSQSSLPVNITYIYSVTGGGGLCPNYNSGAPITLNGSQPGVSYQLYYQPNSGISYYAQGSAIGGTGGEISFPRQNAPGNYMVKATSPSGCVSDMSGILTVYFYDVPNGYTVTGGGDYCAGSSGVLVGLSGSQAGVNYELHKNGAYVGPTISGTGSALNFGSMTAVGSYSVQAVNSGGCKVTTNSVTITASNPVTPSVSISANKTAICMGENVTFMATPTNGGTPSYQWMLNGAQISGAQGSSYSTTTLTNGQQISVVMTTSLSCVTQSAVTSNIIGITVNTAPIITTQPTSQNPCDGSSTSISVGSSNATVYQWYWSASNGPAPQSSPWSGTTTSTLTINPVHEGVNGNYWAVLTNLCGSSTSNVLTISVKPYPGLGGITGPTSVCQSITDFTYGTSSIQEASSYIWTVPSGARITSSATSSSITVNFPAGSISGSVTVAGHNSCGDGPAASYGVTVNVPVTPSVSISANKATICPGENVTFTASPTNGGTPSYQWLLNGAQISGAQGSSYSTTTLTNGQQISVVMTTSLTCVIQSAVTSNSIGITVNPLPTHFLVSGGGSYCYNQAGPEIRLEGSQAGVNYQLYNGSSPVGTAITGTGAALTFGNQTAAGTYTIQAINSTTGCTQTMNGSVSVTVNALPTTYNVTGGGSFCSGGSGTSIGLSGSQTGINYQLYNGVSPVGSAMAGTNGAINFGNQTATGAYTVLATNTNTGCTQLMNGSATVGLISIQGPSLLSSNSVSNKQINLSWSDNSENEDGFKIERKNGTNDYVEIASVGSNVTNYENSNLSSGTTYNYRVYAFTSSCRSSFSNETQSTTLLDIPSIPTGLTSTVVGINVSLSWTDNSNNEEGFKIECNRGNGFVEIANVSSNITSYQDNGLPMGTSHRYRIRAYNNGGASEYSNETVATISKIPDTPANFQATAIDESSINLSWTDGIDETGYRIEKYEGTEWKLINTTAANATNFNVTNLDPNTTYNYRLIAYNDLGSSSPALASATTMVDQIGNPDFKRGAIEISNVIDWQSNVGAYTTENGTPDGIKPSGWPEGPNYNQWFKFRAVKSEVLARVESSDQEGYIRKPYIAIWDSLGHEIVSASYAAGNQALVQTYTNNLIPNKLYYISVDNEQGQTNTGKFGLLVTSVFGEVPNNIPVCEGESVDVTATNGIAYLWSPNVYLSSSTIANPVITPSASQTYQVEITNKYNFKVTRQLNVTLNPKPTANAGNDVSICYGQETQLNASGGDHYFWAPFDQLSSSSVKNPVAKPDKTTEYTVTVVDANNCKATDKVMVTVRNGIRAYAGEDVILCSGESANLLVTGGNRFKWTPSIGLNNDTISAPVANPANTTTYYVQVKDEEGCASTDTVTVYVNPLPQADAGQDRVICAGDMIRLKATGGITYTWEPLTGIQGSNTVPDPLVKPAASMRYQVTVTNRCGNSKTDFVNVDVSTCETYILLSNSINTIYKSKSNKINFIYNEKYSKQRLLSYHLYNSNNEVVTTGHQLANAQVYEGLNKLELIMTLPDGQYTLEVFDSKGNSYYAKFDHKYMSNGN